MKLYLADISGFSQLEGLELLSDERRRRLEKYNIMEDKQRCLVAGLLLRYALGDSVHRLHYGDRGKPYLPDGPCFSLSHSGNYVVLALAECDIGVDIEKLREYKEKLARRCCTEDEFLWLQGRDSADFYNLWTGKEAVMKATGLGFALPAHSFSVLPLHNGPHTINDMYWHLGWHALEGYALCTACREDEESELVLLTKDVLL